MAKKIHVGRSVPDLLQEAVALHQSGQLARAAQIYDAVLKVDPDNGDALNLKGVTALDSGSAAEAAFCNCVTNNKDGFSSLLAVVAPNLAVKPSTVMFNKVTIKGAKQAVQMFGPAQHGVAKAVADSVAEGVIPVSEADDLFISVGVFIHWDASDDKKIQEYNYTATKEAIARAVAGEPKAAEVVAKRNEAKHPFAAN